MSSLYPRRVLLSRFPLVQSWNFYQFICFVHHGGNDSLRPQILQIWMGYVTL